MVDFPATVKLVDTGMRRHPRNGDIYMWKGPKGEPVDGPHSYDGDDSEDDADSWYGGPECYAIYKREE